eukprot:429432-Rhodomonas_salina.1
MRSSTHAGTRPGYPTRVQARIAMPGMHKCTRERASTMHTFASSNTGTTSTPVLALDLLGP